MKFQEAATLLSLFPKSQSVIIIGSPGIGKTSLANHLGELTKASKIIVRDLASHLPEDLLGNPFRCDKVTVHAPPEWLYELSVERNHNLNGVLILDDLGAATPTMQTAVYRLMQEREVGSTKLADGVVVYATTNRPKDKSGASLLPAALRNKVFLLELEPDIVGWSTWASINNVDARVISFLNFKPDLFSKLASDADELGAFPTPRSWANMGKLLKLLDGKTKLPLSFFQGFVGQGSAIEFFNYIRLLDSMPNPSDVIADPLKFLPKPPQKTDILISLITAMARYAAASLDNKMPEMFVKALLHVTQEHNEFAVLGLTTYVQYGGRKELLCGVVKANHKDSKMKSLLAHLQLSKTTAGKT